MGKLWGAIALLIIAAFMGIGALRSAADGVSIAEIIAFLFVVVSPAFFGIKLLRDYFGRDARIEANKDNMRRRTLAAEVLKLAGSHGGKLTIVEVVTALAVTPDDAKSVMDDLARDGFADFQVTDSGVVVYDFHDVRRIGDKHQARGILE